MRRSTVSLVVAVLAVSFALAGDLHFDRLGPSRGLDAENITAVYQDRAGFLWIGSREGLTLYDGYTFTRFEHDVSNPRSISDNAIRTITEDREGNLWIGTNTGGLNRLDRATWTFEAFRHDSKNERSLSHDSVYAVLEDRSGALWVGTQGGLNRLERGARSFDRYLADPARPKGPGHDYVTALVEDRSGLLWIGTFGGGLERLDPASGEFRTYRNDPRDPASLAIDRIFSLAEGSGEDLWVGTSGGLERMDRARGMFRRVALGGADGNGVAALAFDGTGTVWAATFRAGLGQIDAGGDRVIVHRSDRARDDSLSEDQSSCLAQGEGRTLWVGTWGGGLNLLRLGALPFVVLRQRPATEGGLTVRDATAVLEDPRGRLWVGTFGGGLHWRDARDKGFTILEGGSSPADRPSVVLSLVPANDGAVWLGAAEGLFRVDAAGRIDRSIRYDPRRPEGLGPGYVTALRIDREGGLWVGTGGGGLRRFTDAATAPARFVHDPANDASLSDDYVTAISEDRAGTLWVGTRSGGLNALDRSSGRFTRYVPSATDDRSLSHHYVTAVLEDSKGRLWVGTGGGGLDRVERDPSGRVRFARITDKDGLADNNVMSLVEDDDGSLWLGTRRGLCRYDPERGTFIGYGVGDGLPGSEFNGSAAARGVRELYLGTTKGVVVIPRGTPFPRPREFPTRITALRTLAGPIEGDRPVWELDRIRLPYGKVLFVDFAVLDYREGPRHRYAYRLDGSGDDWIDLSNRREITFTDLEPGRHSLVVKGRSAEGVWSELARPLTIEVIPPIWRTNWFRAFLLLVVAGTILSWHSLRTRSLEKRNRELVALQGELQAAYDRLRGLTRRLEAAKEDERKHIARELHDEMGQALTAAKINMQLLAGLADPDTRARRIADTVELVDRMIEHVRALSLDLRPPLLDELGLVAALRGYVEAVAQRSGLAIEVAADALPPGIPAEIEIVVFRVVQESLTNVLRHAGARRVRIEIRTRGTASRPLLGVLVQDDGGGFDVREALERAAGGQHLGLLGILERVRGLGGEAEIDSAPGRGARIVVSVPLS